MSHHVLCRSCCLTRFVLEWLFQMPCDLSLAILSLTSMLAGQPARPPSSPWHSFRCGNASCRLHCCVGGNVVEAPKSGMYLHHCLIYWPAPIYCVGSSIRKGTGSNNNMITAPLRTQGKFKDRPDVCWYKSLPTHLLRSRANPLPTLASIIL